MASPSRAGRARRVAAPLLGAVGATALWLQAGSYDAVAREGQIGPGVWPRLVLTALAVTCVAKAIGDWRRSRDAKPGARAVMLPAISTRTVVLAVALILGYIVAAGVAGFALATVAFVAGFMMLCGARSPLGIAAVSLLGTGVLLYGFVRLVYLPLPKGAGIFEPITLALYRALHLF